MKQIILCTLSEALWGLRLNREISFQTNKSVHESKGFFNESDEIWRERKKRHLHQMKIQNASMTTCDEGMDWCTECLTQGVDCEAHSFYQSHYEPTFGCTFEKRIGNQGDGGKWVCDPHNIRKETCLVYSIGSKGEYDFEQGVHDEIPECEIHTVDMKNWTAYSTDAPPKYTTYHVREIGKEPKTPVSALVQELGHSGRSIDIFKIDCEGCEWESYKSWFGAEVYIRQVLVELHGTEHGKGAHEFFNFMFDKGYVVFHKEPNTIGCRGDCIEYAFIRLTPDFYTST